MVEVAEETTYVPPITGRRSPSSSRPLRHFAAELRDEGLRVDYVRLDEPANAGSFTGELIRAVARHAPDRIVVTEPGEWRVRRMMDDWPQQLGIPVEIREEIASVFAQRLRGLGRSRKSYRMEFFYREMRRRTAC